MSPRPPRPRRPRSKAKAPRKGDQLAFHIPTHTHGGRRPGAGRPRKGKDAGVSHLQRPEVKPRTPVHVTLRLRPGLGALRTPKAYRVIASALFIARARFGVRIVVQSTQRNHMHLIAEARDRRALARAMQGLCIRIARGLNRLWGRKGKVFADRYHARVLATPLEVRRALAYVLLNQRRHAAQGGHRYPKHWVDPFSSGAQFDGWREPVPRSVRPAGGLGPPTVVRPRTWLLREGWRRRGRIALWEVPGQGTKR